MIIDVISLIANLAMAGVNLNARQRAYLKWRASKQGRRYFAADEENKFYEALEAGDVDVIDVGIHERQKQIDGLCKRLKLGSIVLACLFAVGCSTNGIPAREVPIAVVESLTDNEHSYVVEDLTVLVDGEAKELEGMYHVVNSDFIRTFRRNQDTTLEALEQLDLFKNRLLPGGCIGSFLLGCIIVFIIAKAVGPNPSR